MRFKALIFAVLFILFNVVSSLQPVSAYYTNMPASVVIGQADFTHNSINQGGSVGANTLRNPQGIFLEPQSGKLFIADDSNHRMLIYNRIPTSSNTSADVVIGQPNFTSNALNQGGSVAANTLSNPTRIFVEQNTGKLIIEDNGNSRMLIYNRIPTTNNASADVVIGQPNFTSNSVNQGGSASANTINHLLGSFFDSSTGKLFICDRNNNRVLIYNRIPTANNTAADVVIGQTDFSGISINQGGNPGPNTLRNPQGGFVDSTGRLFIADGNNHRVLIFNQVPTSNNASADVVIGQSNLNSGGENQGGSPDANTLAGVSLVIYDQKSRKLIVSEFRNHRVTIFDNNISSPGLSISNTPQSLDGGLVKLTGSASTSVPNYSIQSVSYAVNGSNLNGTTATDGAFDTANENFFFTFDPKANNNKEEGYFVQVQSRTSNFDLTEHLAYFQPFVLNTPEDRSFISKTLPTFSFSVNKQQIQLKQNLQNYRVMVKKSGGDWKTYVDSIPVDYNSIKDSVDNLQKSSLSTNGNGTYEDKKILVVYSNNNSTMTVTPKAVNGQGDASSLTFDQNGKLLNNGGYEWKIQAVDKNGHVQETDSRKFVVGSSQFSNGSNWFPLQINSISGLGRVYLSTIAPQLIKPKYRIQTSNPIFKGVATANSTVQLDLTNQTCQSKGEGNCVQTFTANANGASQFTMSTSSNALKLGTIYQAQLSVSQNGLFNALPPFQVTR